MVDLLYCAVHKGIKVMFATSEMLWPFVRSGYGRIKTFANSAKSVAVTKLWLVGYW